MKIIRQKSLAFEIKYTKLSYAKLAELSYAKLVELLILSKI